MLEISSRSSWNASTRSHSGARRGDDLVRHRLRTTWTGTAAVDEPTTRPRRVAAAVAEGVRGATRPTTPMARGVLRARRAGGSRASRRARSRPRGATATVHLCTAWFSKMQGHRLVPSRTTLRARRCDFHREQRARGEPRGGPPRQSRVPTTHAAMGFALAQCPPLPHRLQRVGTPAIGVDAVYDNARVHGARLHAERRARRSCRSTAGCTGWAAASNKGGGLTPRTRQRCAGSPTSRARTCSANPRPELAPRLPAGNARPHRATLHGARRARTRRSTPR